MLRSLTVSCMIGVMALMGTNPGAIAGPPGPPGAPPNGKKKDKPDYPPFDDVIKDMEKVVSTTDGSQPLIEMYKDEETGKLLGALPSKYATDLYMVASTISGGDPNAGVMGPTHFIKWKKIDKQIAIIEPNLTVRTDGDKQAKDSVQELYKGRVLTSVKILTMTPDKRPVIDLGELGTSKVNSFFSFGGRRRDQGQGVSRKRDFRI